MTNINEVINKLLSAGFSVEQIDEILPTICKQCGCDMEMAHNALHLALDKNPLTKVSSSVVEWIMQTGGAYFDLPTLDKELGISEKTRPARKQAIYRAKQEGIIEPHPTIAGRYRYINHEAETLDWSNADPNDTLDLSYPHGINDGSSFNLQYAKIHPGSIIIIAGVSNQGKTTFCLDFLVENMDKYHCLYMTNEMGPEELKARFSFFDWVNLFDEKGNPKFEAVIRYENYQDIIQPDAINIIDYLDPGENPYNIGALIDQIKQKLKKGIALIAIQKKEQAIHSKEGVIIQPSLYGTGGQYSEHRARLVLHIEKGILLVRKCKSWSGQNPNGRRYSFKIIDGGSRFHEIKEITPGN